MNQRIPWAAGRRLQLTNACALPKSRRLDGGGNQDSPLATWASRKVPGARHPDWRLKTARRSRQIVEG
jgi:hypothetical protein